MLPKRSAEVERTGGPRRALRRACVGGVALAMAIAPVAIFTPPASAVGPDISVSNVSGSEGSDLTFEVRRTAGGAGAETLDYATLGGNATAGPGPNADYVAATGEITFDDNAGGTNDQVERIVVSTLQDTKDEVNETFNLEIRNAGNNALLRTAVGTIRDDDPTPTFALSTDDTTVSEGGGTVTVTATLDAVSGRTVTIPVKTVDGTATHVQDFVGLNTTIVIAAGSTSNSTTVTLNDDPRDEESPEQFEVEAGGVGTVGVANSDSLTFDLTDNDDAPTVSVGGAGVVTEGGNLTFPVTLSAASDRTITMKADTSDGTAKAPGDYTAVTGQTVTFTAGVTSQNVVVGTINDSLDEADEDLTVTLSAPVNATIATASNVGAITDNDAPPTVALTPTTVVEGNSGSAVDKTFTATLSAASGREVKIDYSVGGGTATVGEDYSATSGTLTFAPGDTVKTFKLPVVGDLKDEGASESVNVVLSNSDLTVGSGASLGTNPVTITDDDDAPTFTVPNVSTFEGDSGSTLKDVSVQLSNPSAQPIDFDIVYTDVTAVRGGSAAGSDDYVRGALTLTVAPGDVKAAVSVTVKGDTVYEANETLTVQATRATGETDATGGPATGTLRINNDDAAPTVTFSNETEPEGTTVNPDATITGVAQDSITLNVSSAAGSSSGSTAADPADFTAGPSTPLVISGGTPSGTVFTGVDAIQFLADTIDEPNQTVITTATVGANNAVIVNGVGTITDDPADTAPEVAVGDTSAGEGAGTATVPVTLAYTGNATSTERTIVVSYATNDGAAKAPGDYTTTTGSLTFLPGQVSKNVTVPVNEDTIDEATQAFYVDVQSVTPGDVVVADGTGSVDITDNDGSTPPVIAVSLGDALPTTEGSTASVPVTLTFPGSATSTDRTVVVNYQTRAGSANGADYTPTVAGTVTFAPGEVTKNISVPVTDDTVDEPNGQKFYVDITGTTPGNVQVTDGVAGVEITDNDTSPQVNIGAVTVAESAGTATVPVALTFSGGTTATEQDVTVAVETGNGSAKPGLDYTAKQASVTIPAGAASAPFTVTVIDDDVDEITQSFGVLGTTAGTTNATFGTTGSVTITDNDATVDPTITAPTRRSGAGAVTISGVTQEDAVVTLYGAALVDDGPQRLDSVRADDEGKYTFVGEIDTTFGFYVRSLSKTSDLVKVEVKDKPVLTASSSKKRAVKVRVNTNPNLRGATVMIRRVFADGTKQTLKTGRTDSSGNYSTTVAVSSGERTLVAYVYSPDGSGVIDAESNRVRVDVD